MHTFKHMMQLGGIAAGLLTVVACDYSGDFLFPESAEEVDTVIDLGEIDVAVVTSADDAAAAAIYGQVSATGDATQSGVTYTFTGTGGDVCVWVDPEFLTWNQSVASRGRVNRWAYPDNLNDDGDLDVQVGLAIYYNGSPGEAIGDFAIRYEDSLGNPIEIELNECVIPSMQASANGHSGRGSVESCTISNTQPGVSYVVKMSAWSTPLDDDRLGYGLLLADGSCRGLRTALSIDEDTADYECVVPGEAIDWEVANGPGPWFGISEVPTVAGALAFEQAYCTGERLDELCAIEADEKDCSVEACFCGDPTDTPSGGQF
ncbi:MAG: hypothetical protein ACJAZO_001757 [Myxococcota bacterium]|jgi:hypothetical protein